jgi:hypothetical protein
LKIGIGACAKYDQIALRNKLNEYFYFYEEVTLEDVTSSWYAIEIMRVRGMS